MDRQIRPTSSLKGEFELPPDKSIAHRSALFASISDQPSTILNYSPAADPQSTLSVLRQLGVQMEITGSSVSINGKGRFGFSTPADPLDCGNSGTLMRLITGILAGAGVSCSLVGDESLAVRPMKRIIDPLALMGITIGAENGNLPPLVISGKQKVEGIRFELPIASAQLKSCVLLTGLYGERPTEVIETTPSRNHTETLLSLPVEPGKNSSIITTSLETPVPAQNYRVPGDFSAAAFWLVAGCLHDGNEIILRNVGLNPTRTACLNILQRMRANIEVGLDAESGAEPIGDIKICCSELDAVNIYPEEIPNCIDELPVLCVAMAFANGVSEFRGAKELRYKETDRIQAMVEVLEAAGVDFVEYEDGLKIHGDPDFVPKAATYDSKLDHRIAMASAVLATKAESESTIIGAECAEISYPDFYTHLEELGN